MTTWGGFSILVFLFVVPPIVILHRSRVSGRRLWIIGIPSIALGYYLGWTLGPFIWAAITPGIKAVWPELTDHVRLMVISLGVGTIITATIFASRKQADREKKEMHDRVQKAVDDITEDGVVEGPKGPYVRHKKWNRDSGVGTPSDTDGPGGHGPYGAPMP